MELTLGESRMSGARYYFAKPIWPCMDFALCSQFWNDMIAWCVNEYGPTPSDGVWTPGAKWYANNAKFWFREQNDLAYFILRWGK
jgi:hypothetical protein